MRAPAPTRARACASVCVPCVLTAPPRVPLCSTVAATLAELQAMTPAPPPMPLDDVSQAAEAQAVSELLRILQEVCACVRVRVCAP